MTAPCPQGLHVASGTKRWSHSPCSLWKDLWEAASPTSLDDRLPFSGNVAMGFCHPAVVSLCRITFEGGRLTSDPSAGNLGQHATGKNSILPTNSSSGVEVSQGACEAAMVLSTLCDDESVQSVSSKRGAKRGQARREKRIERRSQVEDPRDSQCGRRKAPNKKSGQGSDLLTPSRVWSVTKTAEEERALFMSSGRKGLKGSTSAVVLTNKLVSTVL